jgi:hypothetical protein
MCSQVCQSSCVRGDRRSTSQKRIMTASLLSAMVMPFRSWDRWPSFALIWRAAARTGSMMGLVEPRRGHRERNGCRRARRRPRRPARRSREIGRAIPTSAA